MTVKDAAMLLKTAKTITLGYGGNAIRFDKNDILSVDAYGKYLIDEIICTEDGHYELNIVIMPVKEGA